MEKKPSLQRAILRTLCYADIFHYPLTAAEISRWLILPATTLKAPLTPQEVSLPQRKLGTSSQSSEAPAPYRMDAGKPRTESQRENTIHSPTEIGGFLVHGVTSLLRQGDVAKTHKFYHLPGRSQIVKLRLRRAHHAKQKLAIARRIARFLRFIPTLKMVAATGALTMANTDADDDIDLMLVTTKKRLWLTRLMVVPLISLIAKRRKPAFTQSDLAGLITKALPKGGNPTQQWNNRTMFTLSETEGKQLNNAICLNLFLDESALAVPPEKRNLYTAHEVAQVKPLWSRDGVAEKFLQRNRWVVRFLPFALGRTIPQPAAARESRDGKYQPPYSFLERLENVAFTLQVRYMQARRTTELVNPHAAYFHPRDTAHMILREYRIRLKHLEKVS